MNPIPFYAFADEAGESLDAQIAAMRRNDLDGLEMRSVEGVNVSALSLNRAREIRERLRDAGLITWSVGSPIGKIDIEKDDFSAHMDAFRHTLEVAHALDAKNIRLFSFFIPKGKNPEDYRDEVLDRLSQMVEAAKGSGVTLCHENEKCIYGDLAPRCLEIFRALPEIRGIFDPANFIQCGQDTAEAWRLLKPYIHYMHIKDALPDGSVVPAGCGIGRVGEIVADFVAGGGNALTLEPHLTVFSGLMSLERPGERSNVGRKYAYPSGDAAFDAACDALKRILKEM